MKQLLNKRDHEILPVGCNSACAGWRLGVAGCLIAEVTLPQSPAADPEYADFHCVTRPAAACFCACVCVSLGVGGCVCLIALHCWTQSVHWSSANIRPRPHKTTAIRPHASIQTGSRSVEGFGISITSIQFNSGSKRQNRRGSCKRDLHSGTFKCHISHISRRITLIKHYLSEDTWDRADKGALISASKGLETQKSRGNGFTLAASPSWSCSSVWNRVGVASSSCRDRHSSASSSRHSEPTPFESKLLKTSFRRSS